MSMSSCLLDAISAKRLTELADREGVQLADRPADGVALGRLVLVDGEHATSQTATRRHHQDGTHENAGGTLDVCPTS